MSILSSLSPEQMWSINPNKPQFLDPKNSSGLSSSLPSQLFVFEVVGVPARVHQAVERVPVGVLQAVKQLLAFALPRRVGVQRDQNVPLNEALLIHNALRR